MVNAQNAMHDANASRYGPVMENVSQPRRCAQVSLEVKVAFAWNRRTYGSIATQGRSVSRDELFPPSRLIQPAQSLQPAPWK